MEWIEPIQALVLLLVGAGVTYFFERRIEDIKAQKEQLAAERARLDATQARLRDERRQIYATILDPYIEVLHELGRGLPAIEANQRLGSSDHRKAAFQLKVSGTDDVVRAFNFFTRYIVDAKLGSQEKPGELLRRWAALIYAIRRSIGDPNTQLGEPDMIVDWVVDMETVYPELASHSGSAVAPSLTLTRGKSVGASAVVGGREISMQRLEELRVLAQRFRDGTATDAELIKIFERIPDAPGAEVLMEPEAIFMEHNSPLDMPGPRKFLDAIRRRNENQATPEHVELLDQLVRFLHSIRGRKIAVIDPETSRSFEIRA